MLRALGVLLALASAVAAFAQGDPQAGPTRPEVVRDAGNDRFVAGGSLRIDNPVAGDLIAAGGSLDVDSAVNGDVVVAGGNVRLDGAVGSSLYAAGGRLVVNGNVAGNARIAGGKVDLGPRAQINGNLSVGGGRVTLLGAVTGYVHAAGGSVYINGPVGGDVDTSAGSVQLGPGARIAGRLRYASREELTRDPAAQVAGGVERIDFADGMASTNAARSSMQRGGLAWSIGLVVFAALLAAALPWLTESVSTAVRTRWALAMLLGFMGLVCIPVAALILVFTLIGIPLALVTVALYLALLLLGYVTAGIATGVIALQRWAPARTAQTWWRVAAAALGMGAIALFARIPAVGGFVVLLAMLLGIGALLMQLRRPTVV